jgi:hypothetical protein
MERHPAERVPFQNRDTRAAYRPSSSALLASRRKLATHFPETVWRQGDQLSAFSTPAEGCRQCIDGLQKNPLCVRRDRGNVFPRHVNREGKIFALAFVSEKIDEHALRVATT